MTKIRLVTFICAAAVLVGPRANAWDALPNTSPEQMADPPAAAGSPQSDAVPETSFSLKSKREQKKKSPATTGSEEGVAAKPAKHPSLTIGHALKLEFTARIEGDMRRATPAMGRDQAQADWQDRRVGIQGTAFRRVDFEVSRELGEDFESSIGLSEKTAWRDVYLDARVAKAFNVEAGRFKLPFGREELTGETNLDFVYRSLAARVLSPGRDPGVMAHGRLFARRVEYEVGYFTRDGGNARTSQTRGGEDARVVRLLLTPFATTSVRAIAALEIGVAIADSRIENRLGMRGRTVLGDGVFFDRVFVNGRRERIGWEAAWAMGPVSLSSEHIRILDERKGMGFSSEDLPSVDATAWYVAGTWAITGERKHGRLEPRLALLRGGIGAVEVAARVEILKFNAATSPTEEFGFPNTAELLGNADRVTTFGVNWYLNHYVKLQANFIRESIDDPDRSPAPTTGGRFTSTVFRIQFRL